MVLYTLKVCIAHSFHNFVAGGGGHNPRAPQSVSSISLAGVVRGSSLMERATSSEDGVPISAVVKFLKCAYNYEQWEVYDMVVQHAMDYIKVWGKNKFLA